MDDDDDDDDGDDDDDDDDDDGKQSGYDERRDRIPCPRENQHHLFQAIISCKCFCSSTPP